jgi:hypothetical protein
MVDERWDDAEHEFVCCYAFAAKATMQRLINVDPVNIIEDLCRPIFDVHDVFTGRALHHALTKVVATATSVRDTTNNEVAGGRGEGDRDRRSQTRLTDIGSGAVTVTLDVQTVGVRYDGVWIRVVVLLGFDVLLGHGSGQRLQNLKCLLSDVKVSLEGPFKTTKGWVGDETADG